MIRRTGIVLRATRVAIAATSLLALAEMRLHVSIGAERFSARTSDLKF